ncbi:MAG: hypothetical protein Q9168_000271 [Polycauliona sp. 1 TL-2023]
MSPLSANQAASGIAADFVVDRVRRHESHRGGAYFAFQMGRPESVRIFDPVEAEQHVECTCEEFQSNQVICTHIYVSPPKFNMVVIDQSLLIKTQWLFDGLNAALQTRANRGAQVIRTGDVLAQISALYGLIGSQLSSLPTLLSATRDEISSDTDDAPDAIGSFVDSDIHAEQVRDMLSVFDTDTLPEDYDPGHASTSASNGRQDLYVPNSLAARARNTFAKLDNYIMDGPLEDASNHDIPRCARTLRAVVDQICQIRDSRSSSGPLSAPVKRRVAEILVEILQEVCNRNEDVYYRIGWEREVVDGEPDRNRNLYTYLIDDPPRSTPSTPNWMKETFVVDRLCQTPADEWRHLIERLTSIVDQMRDRMEDEENPPLAYTKLERMIQEYTAEVFEPSSSSVQRRPTLGSQRQTQRRRFV